MTQKKTVPDSVSASLDYELAVILATHVDQSDEYESRADFVREALWDKLCDEYESSEVLEAFIARQEERIEALRNDAQNAISDYETEVERLREVQRTFNETVEDEADAFFAQLEEADYETR